MTDKHSTQREKLDQLAGLAPRAKEPEEQGNIGTFGDGGPRILIIDDTWSVVEDMRKSVEILWREDGKFDAQITIFRVFNAKGSRAEDLVAWVQTQEPFDAIFIDGNLGAEGNGIVLGREIRKLEGLRFQPLGIITADSAFFGESESSISDGIRIFGKFDVVGKPAIRKIVRDIRDVTAATREFFWSECQRDLIRLLNDGGDIEKAAEHFGKLLTEHYGVHAWYLRERKGDMLVKVAMLDTYGASESLELHDSLEFQQEFLSNAESDQDPWIRKESLSSSACGRRQDMIGHHAIAARVGTALGGGVKALLTAYRTNASEPFHPSDARNLHHIAVLLRLAQGPDKLNERLEELTKTVEKVLSADTTGDMVSDVLVFLNHQINQKFTDQSVKAKTTSRLFLRGCGELSRWGRPDQKSIGTKTKGMDPGSRGIWVRESNSVYARAVLEDVIKTSPDITLSSDGFVETVEWANSYLTVPLEYDGAVLGAINLESEAKSAYNLNDQVLVSAISKVLAASILNHRSRRFMVELSDLSAKSLDLVNVVQPDELLSDGARILYRLCGFSDLLIFEPGQPDEAWNLVQAWKGDGKCVAERKKAEINRIDDTISQSWKETFIYECLTKRSKTDKVFVRAGGSVGLSDVGTEGFRPRGRETLSRVVVFIGEDDSPRQAMMLLFEHPRPLPEHFKEVLEKYSSFLSAVYAGVIEEFLRFGEQLSHAKLEARQGKLYSQVRHSIASSLVLITNKIDIGRSTGKPPDRILEDVESRVSLALKEFSKHRSILKLPEPTMVRVDELWNSITDELTDRGRSCGISLERKESDISVFADSALVEYILFNLVDNALVHGPKNGATQVSLRFEDDAIFICDNGWELPPEKVSRIFKLGYTTSSTGTGQGLHLSNDLALDMSGTLHFKRQNGLNCFVLRLPSEAPK